MLLDEVLSVVEPRPGETILDCTLGFAGHSVPLLQRVGRSGMLVGLDRDADQLDQAAQRLTETGLPFAVRHTNFAGAAAALAAIGIAAVDVILADLGMSSMQLDDPVRGFSYVRDGPLDMRMDRHRGRTAGELLATIPEEELARALGELGDEPHAAAIARAIVAARAIRPIVRTVQLAEVVAGAVSAPASRAAGWRLRPWRGRWNAHPAARTFQALRILVNRELESLRELLRILPQILRPGGRVAIISFHSGEDRLVKTAFRDHAGAGWFDRVADEPVRPTEAEKQANPRARSAKLRWARRSERAISE